MGLSALEAMRAYRFNLRNKDVNDLLYTISGGAAGKPASWAPKGYKMDDNMETMPLQAFNRLV